MGQHPSSRAARGQSREDRQPAINSRDHSHDEGRVRYCLICDRCCSSDAILRDHMKSHITSGARSRSINDLRTEASAAFSSAEEFFVPAPPPPINLTNTPKQCSFCASSFPTYSALESHTAFVHRRNRGVSFLGEEMYCSLCGKAYLYGLMEHVVQADKHRSSNVTAHSGAGNAIDFADLYCELCDKHFRTITERRQHFEDADLHNELLARSRNSVLEASSSSATADLRNELYDAEPEEPVSITIETSDDAVEQADDFSIYYCCSCNRRFFSASDYNDHQLNSTCRFSVETWQIAEEQTPTGVVPILVPLPSSAGTSRSGHSPSSSLSGNAAPGSSPASEALHIFDIVYPIDAIQSSSRAIALTADLRANAEPGAYPDLYLASRLESLNGSVSTSWVTQAEPLPEAAPRTDTPPPVPKDKPPVRPALSEVPTTAVSIESELVPPTYECTLCLEQEDDVSSLACGHLFGTKCIRSALKADKRCPLCRKRSDVKDLRRIFLT